MYIKLVLDVCFSVSTFTISPALCMKFSFFFVPCCTKCHFQFTTRPFKMRPISYFSSMSSLHSVCLYLVSLSFSSLIPHNLSVSELAKPNATHLLFLFNVRSMLCTSVYHISSCLRSVRPCIISLVVYALCIRISYL
jgi:hypothetical protein